MAVPQCPFTFAPNHIAAGSTDMGDLCCVMPVIEADAGGAAGKPHGNDYQIVDPEAACVGSAKMQLAMLSLLLTDGAKRAKAIIENYKAPFASKEAYLSFMDSLSKSGDRITYCEDGTAKVNLG